MASLSALISPSTPAVLLISISVTIRTFYSLLLRVDSLQENHGAVGQNLPQSGLETNGVPIARSTWYHLFALLHCFLALFFFPLLSSTPRPHFLSLDFVLSPLPRPTQSSPLRHLCPPLLKCWELWLTWFRAFPQPRAEPHLAGVGNRGCLERPGVFQMGFLLHMQ